MSAAVGGGSGNGRGGAAAERDGLRRMPRVPRPSLPALGAGSRRPRAGRSTSSGSRRGRGACALRPSSRCPIFSRARADQ